VKGDRKCIEKNTKAGKAVGLVPKIDPYVPEGFRYTSPSVHRGRRGRAVGAQEKRAHGCLQVRRGGKNVFTGYVEKGGKQFKDPFCASSGSSPCDTKRFWANPTAGSCPVQMVYVEGSPALRLCTGPGKAGRILKATSTDDLMKQAKQACKHWKKNVSWDGFKVPKTRDAGIGGRRRRRKKR
jgi:hypothetical protein